MTPSQITHICRICGQSAPLESCKTDEDGKAVHEKCYVGVALRSRSELHESVRKLLNDASKPVVRRCPYCSKVMEFIPITCFFDSTAWEIHIPICHPCSDAMARRIA